MTRLLPSSPQRTTRHRLERHRGAISFSVASRLAMFTIETEDVAYAMHSPPESDPTYSIMNLICALPGKGTVASHLKAKTTYLPIGHGIIGAPTGNFPPLLTSMVGPRGIEKPPRAFCERKATSLPVGRNRRRASGAEDTESDEGTEAPQI